MSYLKKLTIAPDLDAASVTPLIRARTRLVEALNQQLKAAQAMVSGEVYELERTKWETNENTGERVRVPYKVPLRKWYWRDIEGKVRFCMRVGNKRLEVQKGKTNIIVGNDTDLPSVIETCIAAVEAGELDAAINSLVSSKTN